MKQHNDNGSIVSDTQGVPELIDDEPSTQQTVIPARSSTPRTGAMVDAFWQMSSLQSRAALLRDAQLAEIERLRESV